MGYCDHCGEQFKPEELKAELWDTMFPADTSVIVHQSGCAEILLSEDWEVA